MNELHSFAMTSLRNPFVAGYLLALCTPTFAQVTPIMRYNTVSESMYLLQRCGELNEARRAWLQRMREHSMRILDRNAAQWAAHDAALKAEFDQRHPVVAKERCSELSRSTDHERSTLPIAQ